MDPTAGVSDEDLIARIVAGEESLFSALVARYQSRILAHVSRVIGWREDALDLSQEIFLKVFHGLPRYNPQFRFSTWLFRIASNASIDYLRKRRVPTVSMEPAKGDEGPVREYASDGPDPYAVLRNRQRRASIEREIAALPAEFRDLIALRHFAGLSYEEIARARNMPLGTVKNKLFRARAVLKDRLAGELT